MKHRLVTAWRRGGNELAVNRLRAACAARRLSLSVDIAPGAVVEPGVALDVRGPGMARVRLAAGSRIEAGAVLRLGPGADVSLGPGVVVRRGGVLNVTGRLELQGDNLISWGSVVHCADHVVFEPMAGTGDSVTVVDGAHFRRHAEDHWYHNSSSAPVRIAANAWLGSHSTITKGVTVGRAATVAANSLVLSDVEPETLVMGVPATVVKHEINSGHSINSGSINHASEGDRS